MSCVYSGDHKTAIDMSQEDKFFSRLLSKESSRASPSSRRLYYTGGRGSVPFLWESEPGTPKNTASRDRNFADPDTPPLTPPPSFFLNGHDTSEKLDHHYHNHEQHHLGAVKPSQNTGRFEFFRHSPGFQSFQKSSKLRVWRSSNLFSSILPKKLGIRYALIKLKPRRIFSPFSQSEGDTSESQTSVFRGRSTSASWFSSSSSTTSFEEEDNEVGEGSPKSTLCFFGCYRRR